MLRLCCDKFRSSSKVVKRRYCSSNTDWKTHVRTKWNNGDKSNESGGICLIGVPFDTYSSFARGSALAPPIIRSLFHCESSNSCWEDGFDTLDVRTIDLGDLGHLSEANLDIDMIKSCVLDLYAHDANVVPNKFPLFSLGGDHSISYPVIAALSQIYQKPINVIHFDAHSDVYDELDGNKYSHACPFARLAESGVVQKVRQIGIRTLNKHQREQLRKFESIFEVLEMKDVYRALSLGEVNSLTDCSDFRGPVYVSVDIDVLDPAFAPGVSHPTPGGLSTRDLFHLIDSLKISEPIIGCDVVEYNPLKDNEQRTTGYAAASILKALYSKIVQHNQQFDIF